MEQSTRNRHGSSLNRTLHNRGIPWTHHRPPN